MSSDNINFDDDFQLSSEQVKAYLSKFEGEDLSSHYKFKDIIRCNFENVDQIHTFIESNKPIQLSIKDGELYYRLTDDEERDELFTVDTTNSFSKSNVWLYNKLPNVELVFPNISSTKVSGEMTAFYICLVIASVLSGEFLEEFNEVILSYDFVKWCKTVPDEYNFMELSRDWIQMGSETVKMVAAAAKYAVTRNQKKKEIPSQLDLPEDLDLRYKNLRREIQNVRYKYDDEILSPVSRESMTKLEIKQEIQRRDGEIEALKEQDKELYKIWRLLNLNSNVIDPGIKRRYIRTAKTESINVFFDLQGRMPDRANDNDLIALKKIRDKLKREAIRAHLNKLFSVELEKFKEDPDRYCPPNFV